MRLRRSSRSRRTRGATDAAHDWTLALWDAKLWRGNSWLGVPILQWPTDLLVVQEILFEARPRVVVETGTNRGGSAIFFASMLSLVHGPDADVRVVTVDVSLPDEVRETLERHPQGGDRIVAIEGDSKSPEVVERVLDAVGGERETLVFLDSDHGRDHVLGELRAYSSLVPPEGWLLVFDTICRELAQLPGAPDAWTHDNPRDAVETFLAESPGFVRDPDPEKLLVTFAPGGFLRRRGAASGERR